MHEMSESPQKRNRSQDGLRKKAYKNLGGGGEGREQFYDVWSKQVQFVEGIVLKHL